MALDYFGVFPCEVHSKINPINLLQMEKSRNRVYAILDLMRKDPNTDKSKPESEWIFKIAIKNADSVEEKNVRIADLLEEAAPLDELAKNCVKCPFNVRETDFGCGGAIHYPISEKAEEWLMSRLPNNLESSCGQLLSRAINDFNYDGEVINNARNRQEIYESNKPVERKWGSFFGKKTKINSNQILHMTIAVGHIQPMHAKLLAYFTGFLGDDFSLINIPSNVPSPTDDQTTAELKLFFMVAALAGTNDARLFIDA